MLSLSIPCQLGSRTPNTLLPLIGKRKFFNSPEVVLTLKQVNTFPEEANEQNGWDSLEGSGLKKMQRVLKSSTMNSLDGTAPTKDDIAGNELSRSASPLA
ncbi:hypothetical protein MLD38_009562 [Melastoma candidum]|uniref:Uncharacterized protein n=1 Tax=Melastoma candidum TaxID=119954 RepID=A0ACB9RXD1_9MYRT|nr:hypothetical protein MLD38_009562 [Melastoma candidum]